MLTAIIFNVSELNKIDFTQILETDIITLRYSVNQTKTFVSWAGESEPTFVTTMITSEGPYNYTEILDILSGPEWYVDPFIV